MRKGFLFFCFLAVSLFGKESQDCTIVFVHIGPSLPQYLEIALKQARLFNDSEIILIANQAPMQEWESKLQNLQITGISCESLVQSDRHITFSRSSKLNREFRGGFWFLATERFFYLDDLMQQYNLSNIVHLESDVMLYASLEEISPILLKNYNGLGLTFDIDNRCIPGFVFIRNGKIMASLTEYMMNLGSTNDMEAFVGFRNKIGSELVKSLPIVSHEYVRKYNLASYRPHDYTNLVDEFDSLFDAACFGQYLGGVDPRNKPGSTSYVNPHSLVNSALFRYSWERDDRGRLVPFCTCQGKKLRLNNLHIHCKRLEEFYSDR